MAGTVTLTKIQHDKRPSHHANDSESVSALLLWMGYCWLMWCGVCPASQLFENPWPSYIKELQVAS
jgi:hypothetical protein